MSTTPLSSRRACIDSSTFEAFHDGCWHGIDQVHIKDGHISIELKDSGSVAVERINGDHLRMRSRRAISADCLELLKDGARICVLSAHQDATISGAEPQKAFLSWNDAEIISVKRLPHVNKCSCLFSVFINRSKFPSNKQISKAARRIEVVPIENIAILQKLQEDPCVDGYHQWRSTEDCVSLSKSKLLSGTFSSEVALLMVLSTLRGMSFELKMVQDELVCCIPNTDHRITNVANLKVDGARHALYPESQDAITIIRIRRCNEKQQYKIETLAGASRQEVATPEIANEANHCNDDADEDSDVEILYNHISLRHSKRLKLLHDNVSSNQSPSSYHSSSSDFSMVGQRRNQSNKRGVKFQPEQPYVMPRYWSRSRRNENRVSPSHHLHSSWSKASEGKRFKHKLSCATDCKGMIESCIGNIRNVVEKHFEPTKTAPKIIVPEEEDFNWPSTLDTQIKKDEHEDLWKEMEHCLNTLFLEQNQVMGSESSNGSTHILVRDDNEVCKHDYKLNEEIGLICRLCNFVSIEIRHISPQFLPVGGRVACKERFSDKFNYSREHDLDIFCTIDSPELKMSPEGCDDIWSLIPELKLKLHSHQKKAFEFIWMKTAGSLNPKEMGCLTESTGGCVISHSPGAGKTLLMISFMVSYLRLFPKSRPLVLAPKSAIDTWMKEFPKWSISLPVHYIYRYEGHEEMLRFKFKFTSRGHERPNLKLLYLMETLEKLQQWHENSSILFMSYPTFASLCKVDENLEYSKFVADILLNSPGLLILDEGHNPRSTKSKLRKVLMKVKTKLRILLSGTLFQNNFEEYFNTLALARPRFIHDVINELDCDMHGTLKQTWRKFSAEKLARKLFVDKIGLNIEASEANDRAQGFKYLTRITNEFIDFYDAKLADKLPGLQVYTLMLTLTDIQQELLTKVHNSVMNKRCPLEKELLITFVSVHPSLLTAIRGMDKFLNAREVNIANKCKGDIESGCKTKFVIDIVRKSALKGEKVLIFCHYISLIVFFVELLEHVFRWKKGEEVLILQGNLDLPSRTMIIDKFNGDVSGHIKVLIASTTACAEGISLTAASRLIMLDSEWNHSKTRQAIARAFRPGQEKVVYVYLLIAFGTWEEEKYGSNARKAWMAKMAQSGRYIEFSPSEECKNIEDELLKEVVEEDKSRKMIQAILKRSLELL